MKRVLVLGSNGFIGRNLLAALSGDRDVAVTGFGRKTPPNLNGNLQFVQGSIENPTSIEDAVQDQDIIYHLISQTIPSTSWDEPEIDVEKNLIPTLNLIRSAADAGVKKICFASSGGTVYGLNPASLTERDVTDPFSPYGIVKRTIESFLEYARQKHGINYDIYRISNAYGEGQDVTGGLGFINTALENIVNGRPVVVYGDGLSVRDFIHVKDVGRLLSRSVHTDSERSDVFNVSANRAISLNELLQIIKEITGEDFEVEYREGRLNDNKKVMLDNSKIMLANPGYNLISLEDGIRKTYNYLKKSSIYVEKSVR
jgi:UDP-glucose 4-epimerase